MNTKGKTIWYMSVDPAGDKSRTCIDENYVTFDIGIHLMEELGGELQEFSESFRERKKEEALKEIYQEFDRDFRDEMGKEFRKLGKGIDSKEGFQKIVRLNKKVVDFTTRMKNLDELMKDFDEFEKQEHFKKVIVDRLMTIEGSRLMNWYDDVMRFMNEVQVGDMVIIPLKEEGSFAVGKVKGEYEFRQITPDIRHVRKARWKKRMIFSRELYSRLPRMQNVFRLESDAELLVMKLIRNQWFVDRVE
ncbi:MAG: hypothetical protein R2741_11655 [Methanolobus sp.]